MRTGNTRTIGFFIVLTFLWLGTPEMPMEAAQPVVLKAGYKVRIVRAVMIPMRDGKRLSADFIRPDADGRFPAIVMYHPYRKDDVGRGGLGEHYYFAERGFISIRLDARGTGSSEGTNTDEYLPQEQQDGIAMHRGDGIIEVAAESSIRATKTHFHIIVNLNVTRNGVGFFQKQWTATEPRRLL